MAQTIQPHPATSRPRHAPTSARNHLSKTPNHWYINWGLDSGDKMRVAINTV